MKALPTQERAIKKRNALLAAALNEFGRGGFEVATAKSIAAAAGVATGTFYQYFENKNDILRALAADRFAALHEQVSIIETAKLPGALVSSDDAADLFKRVLVFLYEFHIDDAPLHRVLDQRRDLDDGLDEIMTGGEELMHSHVKAFVARCDIDDVDVVTDSLVAMGEGLVHHMVFVKAPKDANKMIEVGANMLASYFVGRPLSPVAMN